jgi:opacity protein-like surface antigen
MKSVRIIVVVGAAVATWGFLVGVAHAFPFAEAGGYISASFPTGDWGKVAGFGIGLESSTTVFPDSSKSFGIRQGSSLIYNFGRDVDVPSANLDTNTSLHTETANTGLWLGVGPAFRKHSGKWRPTLYGTIGVAFNWIDSHLKGSVQGASYDATVGQTSTTFAWTVGAGLSKAMSSVPGGRVELSAEYRSGIDQDYLLPGEVSSSGSSVSWERTHQNADQIIVRIGILAGH